MLHDRLRTGFGRPGTRCPSGSRISGCEGVRASPESSQTDGLQAGRLRLGSFVWSRHQATQLGRVGRTAELQCRWLITSNRPEWLLSRREHRDAGRDRAVSRAASGARGNLLWQRRRRRRVASRAVGRRDRGHHPRSRRRNAHEAKSTILRFGLSMESR
jgi:hypothetical protein